MVRQLALHMDWHTRTTRPGHGRIAARTPGRQDDGSASTETVRRIVRWLEGAGLLGLVSGGTCAAVRAHVLYAGSANLAAVYVLAIPRETARSHPRRPDDGESVDLTSSRRDVVKAPARGTVKTGTVKGEEARAPRGLPGVPHPAEPFPVWKTPENRSEGLAAGGVIAGHDRILGRLSPQHWRSLARRFTAAGWTPGDILHALGHQPGGREHGYTADVRSVAGWARARLALWLDGQGAPVPSPSQRRAAERARVLAEQRARRAARQEAAENRGPESPPAVRTEDLARVRAGRGELAHRGAALARELLAQVTGSRS